MSATLGFTVSDGGPVTEGTPFGVYPGGTNSGYPIISTFIFVAGSAGQIACINSAGNPAVFQVVAGYNYISVKEIVAQVTINSINYDTTASNLWWGASPRA